MIWSRLWRPLGVCIVGILFAHHPMLFSGLRRIQIDHEDPRLINYLLEHGYQRLLGTPLHARLWSPPFFYPAPHALAFSDTLLSAGPIYWAGRLAGLHPDTTFQLWVMTCFVVNYILFYLLLRRQLDLGEWPSAMGGFLFAYAAPRVADIGHPQLLPHFFSIIAVLAILWLAKASERSMGQRIVGWSIAELAIVAQFYSSFYLGWFLVLAMLFVLLLSSIYGGFRPGMFKTVSREFPIIGLASIAPALLISPLVVRYLEVARSTGYRSTLEVSLAAPILQSWVYSGPDSWLYGWMPRHQWFLSFGSLEPAHRIGMGLVTPLLCIAGLWLHRGQRIVTTLAMTGLALFLVVTTIPRDIVLCLALTLLSIFIHAVWSRRKEPRSILTPLALCALLTASLFPASNLLLVCPFVIACTIAACLLPGMRTTLFGLTGLFSLAVLMLGSFFDRPLVLAWGCASTLAILAISKAKSPTIIPPRLCILVAATVAFLVFSPGSLVLWKYIYAYVPAGGAIRVPARAVLLLLIPLSIGFALFWEWCTARRAWKYAVPLGVFCLLEQGISTTTYDKLETRKRVDLIAARVKRAETTGHARAFFHSSSRAGLPNWNDHLDAMWAELALGVPTVNGYSGNVPVGWEPLYDCSIRGEADQIRLGKALRSWAFRSDLALDEIVWVHGDRRLELGNEQVTRGPESSEDDASTPQ